ncbi:MAG: hypothetical protein RLZ77_621 [Bacteroidota bacterium]|jgi:hypothetical protein
MNNTNAKFPNEKQVEVFQWFCSQRKASEKSVLINTIKYNEFS